MSQSCSVDLQTFLARTDLQLLTSGDKVSLARPQLMEVTPRLCLEAALAPEDEQGAGFLQPPQPGLCLWPQLDRGQLELLDWWGEAEVTLGVRLWTNHGSRGRLKVDNLGEDVGVRELGREVSHVLIVHEATEEDIVPAGQDLVWRHLVRYSIDNKYSDLDTISLNVGVNLSRGNKDCLPGLECVHIQQQGSQAAGVA